MVRASARLRPLVSGRRLGVVLVAIVLTAGAGAAVASGNGYPTEQVQLHGGAAWLASTQQGLVTLIDGASDEVAGAVRVTGARKGDELSVMQSGSSAYVVNRSRGTLSRVDGAVQEVSPPASFADADAGTALGVFTSEKKVFVVDGRRRVASIADAVSLRVLDRLSLSAQPGPDQSVVDNAGRLWLLDRDKGGLTWLDSGKRTRPDIGGADSRLLLVKGQPVLVDPARSGITALDTDGSAKRWSCLEIRPGEKAQLLGSAFTDRVFAAVPASGTLVSSAVGRDSCGMSVNVGKPGDDFGPLVEAPGYVFVPNRTSGKTIVVDLAAQRAVADLAVIEPGHRLELLSKDGFVFYNDLDTDRAGVIRFANGVWKAGKPLSKYDASADKGDGNLPTKTEPPVTNPPPTPPTKPPTPPTKPPTQPTKVKPSSSGPKAPPIIRDVTFTPNPVVRWFAVTFTGTVDNAQGATWKWILRGADGTVVHTSNQAGGFTYTPNGDHGTEFTVSLEVDGPGGTAGPVTRDVQTTSELHPVLSRLRASDATPGLGQAVSFTADEPVAGARGKWSWTITNVDTGQEVHRATDRAGLAPLPFTFAGAGRYRVDLTATFDGASDQASLTVTAADRCSFTTAYSRTIDLRRNAGVQGVDTARIGLQDCYIEASATPTLVGMFAWLTNTFSGLNLDTSTGTGVFSADMKLNGRAPVDGTNAGAFSFQLAGKASPSYTVLANRPPVVNEVYACSLEGTNARFVIKFTDADVASMTATISINGGPSKQMTPFSHGDGGFFEYVVPRNSLGTTINWTGTGKDAYNEIASSGAGQGTC